MPTTGTGLTTYPFNFAIKRDTNQKLTLLARQITRLSTTLRQMGTADPM